MRRQRGLTEGQRKLWELLIDKERSGQKVFKREILAAAGWQPSTLRTYLKKGYFSTLLTESGTDEFTVAGVLGLSESEFLSSITQTQTLREVGAFCKHKLAQELVKKSRENMILALEIFNRPTIGNRLDGFAIMSIAAWEQLLKASIVETAGEEEIFRPMRAGRHRETIGLRECLERTFDRRSPVRKNIERLQFLRDQAIHLLMPEVAPVLSRLFQSCVFNYAKFFKDLCRTPFLSDSSIGLLALMGDPRPPTIVHLTSRYGPDISREILGMCHTIEREVSEVNDPRHAIPIDYRLVFTKSDTVGEISLSKAASSGIEALVVTKPVDHEKSHPYLATEAIHIIERLLSDQLASKERLARLNESDSGDSRFTMYDFLAIVHNEKWRNSPQNQYYYRIFRPEIHRYSHEAVEFVVERISTDPHYLHRVRRSYSKHRRQMQQRQQGRIG